LVAYLCVSKAQTSKTSWTQNSGRRPLTPQYVREADVGWAKRIWRIIDLRDRLNYPLYFPHGSLNSKSSLFDVIYTSVMNGSVIAYNPNDDEFTTPLTTDEFRARMRRKDSSSYVNIDNDGNEFLVTYAYSDSVSAANIIQYYVKEDWFFDTRRSVLDVRILGICPVIYDESKELFRPLFWVYMDECRTDFVSNLAGNGRNTARELSFDDIFMKRMFNSYITKESNLFDRSIEDYTEGKEKWLEAERIKKRIYDWESDLWQY
jgi:gliding motility associated protien GldN